MIKRILFLMLVSAAPLFAEFAPQTPTNLVAIPGNGSVTLDWSANGNPSGAIYLVQSSTTNGGPYFVVGETTNTNYTVTPLANGQLYFFVVSAMNFAGQQSPNSSQKSASPSPSPLGLSCTPSSVAFDSGNSNPITVTCTEVFGWIFVEPPVLLPPSAPFAIQNVSSGCTGGLVTCVFQVYPTSFGNGSVSVVIDYQNRGQDAAFTIPLTSAPPAQQFWTLESTGPSSLASPETAGNINGSTAYTDCTISTPCPQPLYITFDTNAGLQAHLGGTSGGSDVLTLTNSVDSADAGVTSSVLTNWCNPDAALQLGVTNEDSVGYVFSGNVANGPCAGSPYSLIDPLGNNYTLTAFPDPSGTYTGSFDDSPPVLHSQGGSGTSTLTMAVNSDFSVNATLNLSPTFLASCFVKYGSPVTFTTTDPVAINWGVIGGSTAAVISGDLISMAIGDNLGDVIWLTATDTDANGNQLSAGSLFVTGYVAAGKCAGLYFFDAPFTKKGTNRRQVRKGHHHHVDKRMQEFLKKKN